MAGLKPPAFNASKHNRASAQLPSWHAQAHLLRVPHFLAVSRRSKQAGERLTGYEGCHPWLDKAANLCLT